MRLLLLLSLVRPTAQANITKTFNQDWTFFNAGDEDAGNSKATTQIGGNLSSRWYSGSGLYRNIWRTTSDKVHIPL